MEFQKTTIRVLIKSNGLYSIRDVYELAENGFFVCQGKEEGRAFVKLQQHGRGTSAKDMVHLKFQESGTEHFDEANWKIIKK